MEDMKKFVNYLSTGKKSYADISERFDISKREARSLIKELQENGIPIEFDVVHDNGKKEFYIDTNQTSMETERHTDYFALISDTHMGAEAAREECLQEFYDIVNSRGIQTVFHCGDLITGEGIYRGQQFENKIQGINNQCEHFVKEFPKLDNGKTIGITGNHDLRQFQNSGVEVGNLITLMMGAAGRDDWEYIGRYLGRVVIDDEGHTIDLNHYMKGAGAYTLGYRAQVRQRDEPPHKRADILALGHKHVTLFADYNDQIIFEAGCFQDQTDYLLSKGINSNIGGWIVELEIDGDKIVRVKPELIKFE